MTDINQVILIGRLTRDLEQLQYLPNGTAKAQVSIAVNRSVRDGEMWADEASYFDVEIWGKTAENLKPYLRKGTQIAVQGSLRQDRWEKDGQKFSKVKVSAMSVQLLGGKRDGDSAQTFTRKADNSEAQRELNGTLNSQPETHQVTNADGFVEDFPWQETKDDMGFSDTIPF